MVHGIVAFEDLEHQKNGFDSVDAKGESSIPLIHVPPPIVQPTITESKPQWKFLGMLEIVRAV